MPRIRDSVARSLGNARDSLKHSGVSLTLLRTALWPLARSRVLRLRVRIEHAASPYEIAKHVTLQNPAGFLHVSAPYDAAVRELIERVSPMLARGPGQPTGAVLAMAHCEPLGVWAYRMQGDEMIGRGAVVTEAARGLGIFPQMIAAAATQSDDHAPKRVLIVTALTNLPARKAVAAAGLRPFRLVVTADLPGPAPRKKLRWERAL